MMLFCAVKKKTLKSKYLSFGMQEDLPKPKPNLNIEEWKKIEY